MLPKQTVQQTVPEGSRKVLNGREVYTRRNYTTDRGNFFETMGGEFILPNGDPIEDVSILESLPEPQRQKALAWWDRRFGGGVAEEGAPPAGRKMTKAELRAKAQFLLEQAEMMEDEEVDEVSTEDVEVPEPVEVASGQTAQPKEAKETKRVPGKSKNDKEPNVLTQMGIRT